MTNERPVSSERERPTARKRFPGTQKAQLPIGATQLDTQVID
jgi:hypothetical protein